MKTNFARVCLLAILAVIVTTCALAAASAAGCAAVSDAAARLVGSPTSHDFESARAAAATAERSVAELRGLLAEAQRAAAAAAATRAVAVADRASITEQIAQTAQMLAGAQGERATAIVGQLDSLRARLAVIDARSTDAATLESSFAARALELDSAITRGNADIESARAALADLGDRQSAAITRAGASAAALGQAAGALGVPGAAGIGDQIGGLITGGLAALFGVGVPGALALRRSAASAASATAEARAAKEIITATEEFGLLMGADSGAKAEARKSLSSAALDLLRNVTAEAEKGSRGPVARGVVPATIDASAT